MRVGWMSVDCKPGHQIGSDEFSWAFDGYNVRKVTFHYSPQVGLYLSNLYAWVYLSFC